MPLPACAYHSIRTHFLPQVDGESFVGFQEEEDEEDEDEEEDD